MAVLSAARTSKRGRRSRVATPVAAAVTVRRGKGAGEGRDTARVLDTVDAGRASYTTTSARYRGWKRSRPLPLSETVLRQRPASAQGRIVLITPHRRLNPGRRRGVATAALGGVGGDAGRERRGQEVACGGAAKTEKAGHREEEEIRLSRRFPRSPYSLDKPRE
ncbi:hypothetical protein MTO96_027806 [Rhipicephalus appendiculatus]